METKTSKIYNESDVEIILDDCEMSREAIFGRATYEIMRGNVNLKIMNNKNNLLLYVNCSDNRSSGLFTDPMESNYDIVWCTWVSEHKELSDYIDVYQEYKKNNK